MIQAVVKKGKVLAEQVPAPVVSDNSILVKVVSSCISAGTELSGVAMSGKPLIQRALEQPDKVKKILRIAADDGLARAIGMVRGELDAGRPVGYSAAGVVVGIGKGVEGFSIGDRVAAAGSSTANHAEFIDVPVNLAMRVPHGLDLKQASTATIGGIALQGVRRCDLKLGEFCVVTGCGVIGLIAVQLLAASGIRVIAVDVDDNRLDIAKRIGAEMIVNTAREDAVKAVGNITGGHGADAVLFAAAVNTSAALSDSFKMCRKKGKVVMLGVSGMDIKREDMYPKELDFIFSTSYGPGRYDDAYEKKGFDYPYAYVRWTENRNMQEYLRLLSQGVVKLDSLTSASFSITNVTEAFEYLKNTTPRPLLVFLEYGEPQEEKVPARNITVSKERKAGKDRVNVAVIGAGGFAAGTHLPNLAEKKDKFCLRAVMSRNGLTAGNLAKQYGAAYATTDYDAVLNDADIELVMITTRHDTHAELTLKALKAGKNVFVEKPLAVSLDELEQIEAFYAGDTGNKPLLMVGFNRRFSRYAREIKVHTDSRTSPLYMTYRMNAGYIPAGSWVHEAGGRIVGEVCHIVDLMQYLTGAAVSEISAGTLRPGNEKFLRDDNVAVTLNFADGSLGAIQYCACGSKALPKEYCEIHFDEKSFVLDDYRSLKGYGLTVSAVKDPVSAKGHKEELEALHESLKKGGRWPIPLDELISVAKITLMINDVVRH